MAGDGENLPGTEDEKVKYGFKRPEMYQSPLAGTVDPYDRHVFLCYKSHEAWPARVEDSDSDLLPKLFASALKSRKNEISPKARLTICEGGDDVGLADGDVLVFPDNILYRGLKDSDVETFVDDVLVRGNEWTGGKGEVLTGAYVFVCCHNNRDRRCGVCGPLLIEKFKEVAYAKDVKQSLQVTACSHIGGHKYAGNIIIFSANAEKNTVGNWYGYVTPDDVLEIIEKQIIQGEVVRRLWRGQMGAPTAEPEKVDEVTLSSIANGTEKQLPLIDTEQKGGCCQGANGSSCCMVDKPNDTEKKTRGCCQAASGGSSWCKSENLKSIKTKLFTKWEQHHVLTSLAVVGVVAAVLVVAHTSFHRTR